MMRYGLFAVLLSTAACDVDAGDMLDVKIGEMGDGIQGSGMSATETRQLAAWDRVEAHGIADVILTQGPASDVVVQCDDNLVPHVMTTVEGSTLKIHNRDEKSLVPKGVCTVSATAPRLLSATKGGAGELRMAGSFADSEKLGVSGSAHLRAEQVMGSRVELVASGASEIVVQTLQTEEAVLKVSGSGDLVVSGTCERLMATVSGAGKVQAEGLHCATAKADSSGSAKLQVHADENTHASASGASSIRVHGGGQVTRNASGAASITEGS